MAEAAPRGISSQTEREAMVSCRSPEEFTYWFSRCCGLLRFTACRMLRSPEKAEAAVENCRRTASRISRTFDREGAFRSWLLRVLIDEALAILRQDRSRKSGMGAFFHGFRDVHFSNNSEGAAAERGSRQ